MFHVELRQRPNVARAFNLTQEEVREQFLVPLGTGRPFAYSGHEWDGGKAELTVLEGPRLEPNQLIFGRGWPNAQKLSTDVSAEIATQSRAEAESREVVGRLQERILGGLIGGPIALAQLLPLADDLLPGRGSGERLAAVAQAVWELLHRHRADLVDPTGSAMPQGEWQQALLAEETWSPDQATTSAISLARSSSDANR
jgi:hypothetical protein